jgi:uncharacterized membrane protein YfcA
LEAVPLMMACSIGVQAANLWALRRSIQWGGSAFLIAGGALGIPIAVYLLQNTDTYILRVGFGVIVSLYAGYMLFRPALARAGGTSNRHLIALIGFGGGLIGGLTAMPGAIPTIWCDMRGMPKSDQRGLVQPFIAIMQVFALALLLERHSLSSKVVIDLAISLPALFAGTVLGILAFRNINEVGSGGPFLWYCCFPAPRSHLPDRPDFAEACGGRRIRTTTRTRASNNTGRS